jgi:putative ABC transport system permease protein
MDLAVRQPAEDKRLRMDSSYSPILLKNPESLGSSAAPAYSPSEPLPFIKTCTAVLEKVYYNFAIAADAISHNRMRALLTSLGIIFGVASVISMLAIGNGAQQEILQQIQLLGANNVIITPIVQQEEGQVAAEDDPLAQADPFTPGLTLADARSISAIVPGVKSVSPEIILETTAIRSGIRRSTKLVGVDNAYFTEASLKLQNGSMFTELQLRNAEPVCIIGQGIKTRFFPREEAVGQRIKLGKLWLTVIGVMEQRDVSVTGMEHLGIRDYDLDIYAPIETVLLRYRNRALLTASELQEGEQDELTGLSAAESENYHQLDRVVVHAQSEEYVKPIADVASRMLQRRHYGVVDYQVTVPEVLLAQQQRTRTIFNIVLVSIASISLIVGGIGIMNIMLASVMERTKEIGVRRSLGATRRDVTLQFLIEAITISFTGGIVGVLLGIVISVVIEKSAGILTLVSIPSVFLSFLVSVSVGLLFGYLPAQRASEHDPVVALRYE